MEKRLNVVLITTDQHRADIRKSEGFALDTMPFLDAVAKKGVDFKRAYTSSPVCSPARTSIITGRYPQAAHVKVNPNKMDKYCSEDVYDILHKNGYKIGLVGKDHTDREQKNDIFDCYYNPSSLMSDPNRSEGEKAFDEYRESLHHLADHNPANFSIKDVEAYRFTSKAIEFMESNCEDPFFIQLGIREPHNPYYAPEPYFSMFNPPDNATGKEDLINMGPTYSYMRKTWEEAVPEFDKEIERTKKNYCGFLRIIDEQIERVYDYLEKKDLLKNTVIIYVSDHGDFFGEYGLIRKGVELPEVLCRIPLVFVGANIGPSDQKLMDYVSICDIMPTICEMIGAELPSGVQGRSLLPILEGREYPKEEFRSAYVEHGMGGNYYDEDIDLLTPGQRGINKRITIQELNTVTSAGKLRTVVMDNWKLTFDMMGNGKIFNLEEDQYEVCDLYNDDTIKEKKIALMEELLKWTIKTTDDLPYPHDPNLVVNRDKVRNYSKF